MTIVEQIIQDIEYKKVCRRVASNHHTWEDLYQEFIVALLRMHEPKLRKMQKEGWLRFFLVKTITNTWSKMNRKPFDARDNSLLEAPEEEYEETEQDKLIKEVESALESKHWFDRELLKAVADLGSMRKLSKKTGICFGTIEYRVNKLKKKIKDEVAHSKRK